MSMSNPQSGSTSSNLSNPQPAVPDVSGTPASPSYRRIAADLELLEASLSPVHMDKGERDGLRRRAAYPKTVMHACAELTRDPVCVEHHITFPAMSTIEPKLSRIEEAERLARGLRRLARLVSDDALMVKDAIASQAMRTLDRLEALAAEPEGAHLRSRVEEARKLVRADRAPARRRPKAPSTPKA